MTGVAVTLDTSEFGGALDHLGETLRHPRGAMEALGAHFVFSTQQNFEAEKAPDGTPWRPLSPRTANQRIGKRVRGTAHILRVSARLYQSVVSEATDDSVEWGSNLVYARIHQLGGEIAMPERTATVRFKSIRKKGGGIRWRFVRAGTKGATEKQVQIRGHKLAVPARPYLGISAFDRQAVPEIVHDFLEAEIRR